MIKTTIIGMGKIGYLYDRNKNYKKVTHFSSIKKSNNFKIVSVVEKNNKVLNIFKNQNKIPAYNDIFEAIDNHQTELLVIACELNFNTLRMVIDKTNIKYILVEKPFIISKKNLQILRKLLIKNKISLTINFQRNFSNNYIKFFSRIKNGLIGNQLKCYCYFNKSFEINATHFLNLILLFNKKLVFIKKINKDCIYIKFNKVDAYFFNVEKKYNNNSMIIFGSKGKIEISSRPEKAKLYLLQKDKTYKNINILNYKKIIKLYEKFPQLCVLKNIYETIKFKKNSLVSMKHIMEYLNIMQKIKKIS